MQCTTLPHSHTSNAQRPQMSQPRAPGLAASISAVDGNPKAPGAGLAEPRKEFTVHPRHHWLRVRVSVPAASPRPLAVLLRFLAIRLNRHPSFPFAVLACVWIPGGPFECWLDCAGRTTGPYNRTTREHRPSIHPSLNFAFTDFRLRSWLTIIGVLFPHCLFLLPTIV